MTKTLELLNGRWHEIAMRVYLFIVVSHWAEHLLQAFQIWVRHWPRPQAKGFLGLFFPWLVSSEWLHYAYALIMLLGLILLRPGCTGRSRYWWNAALIIQFWHHIEHLLLFIQAQTHHNFFGASAPTSIAQLLFPRVELHLFYNAVVFIPMVVGMIYHIWPPAGERSHAPTCSCSIKRGSSNDQCMLAS